MTYDGGLAVLARERAREVPEVVDALLWLATFAHLTGGQRRRDACLDIAEHLLVAHRPVGFFPDA